MMYIYQRNNWPNFTWDKADTALQLAEVKFAQGRLLGKMSNLGFQLQEEALIDTLTINIVKTSEIENEKLNPDAVRSSIARHLGVDIAGLMPADRAIDGVVEMHLDATQNYQQKLTLKRLCHWHAALFPSGLSGMLLITPGFLRTAREDPMQVVSGHYGRQKIHFAAPPAAILQHEVKQFLAWFNQKSNYDLLIKAAVAHLWFVTLHPFGDGNGRISRAIADMALAQSDQQKNRYYSMSAQIRLERQDYYEMLESTQKGELDITPWIMWFLQCLLRSITVADKTLLKVFNKAKFWEMHAAMPLNERQIKMLNALFDGFKGKLTTGKWAKMTKCSQDTAARDIKSLIDFDILIKSGEGGRSTHYLLNGFAINYIE